MARADGARLKVDSDVPSPAQFNHVITVIPHGTGYTWLDTTPEVAPYGLLEPVLRDEKALVIPVSAPATLVTTPAELPFRSAQDMDVKASLSKEGTLTGHFQFTLRGDMELLMRSLFHQAPASQWVEITQQLVRLQGFAGTVSNVEADNPDALANPFHYSFDYVRPTYSDWANHRTSPPLFPLLLAIADDAEKPTEPIPLSSPGEMNFRSTITLPEGYTGELPSPTKVRAEWADFDSSYQLKQGASRCLTVKKATVPVADWEVYRKFAKQVADDHDQLIQLTESSAQHVVKDKTTEAEELTYHALQAVQKRDINPARDLLTQAEQLNSKQRNLWFVYGAIYASSNQLPQAAEAFQKEIELYPDNTPAYRAFAETQARLGKREQATETLRSALRVTPDDVESAKHLSGLLLKEKRYEEDCTVLRPLIDKSTNSGLRRDLARALLMTGNKEEGKAVLEKYVQSGDADALNDAAYSLADADTDLPLAKSYGEEAVAKLEEASNKLTLPGPEQSDLHLMNTLAAAWDTLGWVYFRNGDLNRAESYAAASWELCQRGQVGDHLAQIYEKQGKHQAAVHTWQLALAADRSLGEVKERLSAAGASVNPDQPVFTKGERIGVPPSEELGRLRNTNVPALPKQQASAELYVLLSSGKVEDTQFISGSDSLKEAKTALKTAAFHVRVPDGSKGKLLRRGILSCSTYTNPSCQFVMLLPNATSALALREQRTNAQIEHPTLITKTEPQYSEAARKARVQGTVLLSIVVDEKGAPRDISVMRSLGSGLDKQAQECVSQWRFNPAKKDGKPLAATAQVEVNFRLLTDAH